MNEKEYYTASVKAILLTLAVILGIAAIVGTVAARLETQAFLKKNPQAARVVQTIQTQSSDATSFVSVIEAEKGNVVGVLDSKNSVAQLGVALTADGLFITPVDAEQKNSVSVLLADGKIVNAARLRVYPEKGMALYRASSAFSAPQFPSFETIATGTEGILVRLINNNARTAVFPGIVEFSSSEESLDSFTFRERQTKLAIAPGDEYLGAPFFDAQRNLLGVVVNGGKGIVLPVGEINLLLQDYLRHGAEEAVSILSGLDGAWVTQQNPNGKMGTAFSVEALNKNSVFAQAGLEKQDIIYAVNDKYFPTAQLWGTFLESARASKPVTLGVMRGKETLKIPVTVIIQNATQQ